MTDGTGDPEDGYLGIAAAGAYAPRTRIDAETIGEAWDGFEARGIESKAVPDGDEDALTMAVEAAERALAEADVQGADIAFLAFATTTPPLAESDLTARLGSMLDAPADATHHEFTGSTRAGTRALAAALDAGITPAIVVASDCPRGELADARDHAAGAGAAAFVVDHGAPLAVRDRAEHAAAYPGTRFRGRADEAIDGIDVTSYDRSAFVETVAGAVDGLADVDPDDLGAAAIQAPDGDLPYRAAGAIDVDREAVTAGTVAAELGDCGAASALLGLVRAVEDGRESTLLVGYGSGGGADAFSFAGTCPVDAVLRLGDDADTESLDYAGYLRRRDEITPGEPAGGGAYVSVPTWHRSLPQRHRLVAGHCPECDGLAFPPEGACPNCQALVDFEPVGLPREGTVETATTIGSGGAPPEFAPQQARSGDLGVAIVAFEREGDSVSVPLQAVAGGDSLEHGDRVETVIRHLYTQEGVPRYVRKARLIRGE